ncbi:MAG TPA: hypothetical protein VIK89_04405 [Cytophagaceae bacterium]
MRQLIFSIVVSIGISIAGCGEKDKSSSGIDTGNSDRNQILVDTAEVTGKPNAPVDTGEIINTSGEEVKYDKKSNQSFDTTAN